MYQELAQEIENTAKSQVENIHTALPGTIVKFNTSTGLANVQPSGEFKTEQGTMQYPILTDAPIAVPYCQAAGCGLAFPIHEGDSCIIVISEVELNAWRSGAKSEGSLRFDLSNAMVIPGLLIGGSSLFSKATASNSVILGAGGVEISVSSSGVTINGNVIVTGDVKAGEISLTKHTHTSSDPGSTTSTPK